ncbi:hypothetical protein AAE478_006625 [Parahypoxylon ruwenzoriense]
MVSPLEDGVHNASAASENFKWRGRPRGEEEEDPQGNAQLLGMRRKTRCQFSSSAAAVCIGCEARKTACVSQEFADEQPQESERGLSQRLSRVEGLLEKIVEQITPHSYTSTQIDQQQQQQQPPPLTSSASAEEDDLDSPGEALRPSAAGRTPAIGTFNAIREDGGTYAQACTSFAPTPASTQGEVAATLPTKYRQISKALHAAFPCQHDIDAIVAIGSGSFFVVTFFNGFDSPSEPPSSVSEVPPVASHPTLLAKRLMQVTICIQRLSRHELPRDLVMGESALSHTNGIVNLVSELVVSNDDLIGSVEGLETLHLIAIYHANAGNLRKSWLALRRAIAVAQLMGVDRWREDDDKPLKSVDPRSDPSTRTRASGIWYRLNSSDRYLSLLLGLPAASDDDSFASPERTAGDSPTERLEKLHTVIMGTIIKRNSSNGSVNRGAAVADAAFGTTQAIDCDLELAAKSMGASWWCPVELPADPVSTLSPRELVHSHAHVMLQMNHHHLLILLHLPYMMRDPKERRWDYSKTTCLSSSRELLRAYIVFRRLSDAATACRHTDYGALTAAMTLLLGYLDPKLRARRRDGLESAIVRQRELDRELILAIRDIMKGMAEHDGDKPSQEASDIITRLLPLTDVDLTTTTAMNAAHGGFSDVPVRLEIPYLGTINISPVSRRTQQHQSLGRDRSLAPPPYGADNGGGFTEPDRLNGSSVSSNTHGNGNRPENMLMDPGLQQLPQGSSSFLSSLGEDANFSIMQIEPDLTSPYQFPEFAADVDQWTFQGFDAAFFESLFS